jgi:hypothetical protein
LKRMYGRMTPTEAEETVSDIQKVSQVAKEKGAVKPDYKKKSNNALLYFFLVSIFAFIVGMVVKKRKAKDNNEV